MLRMLRTTAVIAVVVVLIVGGTPAGRAQVATPRPHPAASPVTDLTRVAPQALTGERRKAFEDSLAELMDAAGVPGSAVAAVQAGEIVYLEGFGVREIGETAPVSLDTH
jgi:CubicO group peptidase (beta-lactamase class C family)